MTNVNIYDREQRPDRTPEMIASGHQHWAWMAGANPPRWEVVGMGLILDDDRRLGTRALPTDE